MFVPLPQLHAALEQILRAKGEQGYEIREQQAELMRLPLSYDALFAFWEGLSRLQMRPDWPWVEPTAWEEVRRELGDAPKTAIPLGEAQKRAETAFLSSVCGCELGKPLEIVPTLDQLREAFMPLGEWPIRDYISLRMVERLPTRLPCCDETCRETIRFAAADDDLNYSVIGMLALEKKGLGFRPEDLADLWLEHLPAKYVWGPERLFLMRAMQGFQTGTPIWQADWADRMPLGEQCGAMIRADAYGYACPGDPMRAAELAFRDASMTHRRTGVYGAMFAAAAIAQGFVAKDPLEIYEAALLCVPKRSRFADCVRDCLSIVRASADFDAAYRAIHEKYDRFTHCMIYQETGTMINTLRFARDIGHGLCLQVMQGNDTDSYGCTIGSILGAYFGPGHLEERWLQPFRDEIRLGMGNAPEHVLSRLAARMGRLPALTIRE